MKAAVIDIGSGSIKAGFGGQDSPKVMFPSVIGKPRHDGIMPAIMGGKEVYIGEDAIENRGVLRLTHPIEAGSISDWEGFELLLHHTFYDELMVPPHDAPLLLTETPQNDKKKREKLTEILFETLGIPSLLLQSQPILALAGTGLTSGVVVDSGAGSTHIVPIYQGYAIDHGVEFYPVNGSDITNFLISLLRERGYDFRTSRGIDIVCKMKEELCYVHPHAVKDISYDHLSAEEFAEYNYKLPDGQEIVLSRELPRATEALFFPSLIGKDHPSLGSVIFNSIVKCDVDIRNDLFNNIVLCGGNTLFKGFASRLRTEVDKSIDKGPKIHVNVIDTPEREYSVWLGGSILTRLTTFDSMVMTAKEYDEQGVSIVHTLL
ncbi:Actin [Aduncisulcus paluster]|uniref:Actin n=1 Tax=Aduncisulcus paluster TaxID=2918883 RepID=A0ABQ5K347_9EUKA|nr:Actin [Aduncisulcus paluster]